jgi:hypothetical protein
MRNKLKHLEPGPCSPQCISANYISAVNKKKLIHSICAVVICAKNEPVHDTILVNTLDSFVPLHIHGIFTAYLQHIRCSDVNAPEMCRGTTE